MGMNVGAGWPAGAPESEPEAGLCAKSLGVKNVLKSNSKSEQPTCRTRLDMANPIPRRGAWNLV